MCVVYYAVRNEMWSATSEIEIFADNEDIKDLIETCKVWKMQPMLLSKSNLEIW